MSTSKLVSILSLVVKWAVIVGMGVAAAMMLVTTANVALRYVANLPIKGADEIIGLLLVCLTATGIGYCQLEKNHVRVSMLFDRLPKRGQAIMDSLAYFIGFAGVALIGWYLFSRGVKYIFLTRGNITEVLGVYYFPFMFILFFGFLLLALILLINLVQSIDKVLKNE
jgi:TRAP-type C4-dicarboxylate transport system permease small subunit